MYPDETGIPLPSKYDTCGSCGVDDNEDNPIEEQYSFGVYAGTMCRNCAISKFRDHCGHEPSDLTIADLDEPYWEEE